MATISLYRLIFRVEYHERFQEVLAGIRPDDNKIKAIESGFIFCICEVYLSKEEVAFMKLSIPELVHYKLPKDHTPMFPFDWGKA
jgi:hypothetical protein